MSNNSKQLLPFYHNESRPANELALPTILNRKRDYPTSDSICDFDGSTDADSVLGIERIGYKRIELSSDFLDDVATTSITLPPSSPPRPEPVTSPIVRGGVSAIASRLDSSSSEVTLVSPGLRLGRSSSAITARSSSFGFRESKEPSDVVHVIQKALESDGEFMNMDLDGYGIEQIPDEIADVKNFVSLGTGFNGQTDTGPLRTSVKMYLSNNNISHIPPSLFQVENITVLSLRNNNLKQLPSAIYRLKNLVDLSVGGNELNYLPSQIRLLPHLSVLTTHPNPFFEFDEDKLSLIGCQTDKLLRVSKLEISRYSNTPPLSELCLRYISTYRASEKEISKWELADDYLAKISHSVVMKDYANTCGQCGHFMINPISHVFEWWMLAKAVHVSQFVVLKREFCSGNCIQHWKQSIA
ncbi:hypothetical protein V1514DRAFT_323727 [Lipomyces japonicus]|uniref:uncharacterized protein n=1 Tax=Lipomyces japonicus TaxID=56871 RepID=UPI0034CFB044